VVPLEKIIYSDFHNLIHNEINRFFTNVDLWKKIINITLSIYCIVKIPVKNNNEKLLLDRMFN